MTQAGPSGAVARRSPGFWRDAAWAAALVAMTAVAIYYYRKAERAGAPGVTEPALASSGSPRPLAAAAATSTSAPDQEEPRAPRPRAKTELTEIERLLKTDAQFEAALLSHLMAQSDAYYGAFAAEAKLSRAEVESLRFILANKQVELFKSFCNARADGGGAVLQAFFGTRDTLNREIQSTLGPEKFEQLMTYEASIGLRNNLNQYRSRLSSLGIPLTDEQVAKAATALADRTPQRALERQGNHLQPSKIEPVSTADIDALAAILAPEQIATLKQEMALHEEREALVPQYRKSIEKALKSVR